MAYFKNVDEKGEILKILNAKSQKWCEEVFGGIWEQITKQEIEDNNLVYYSGFMEEILDNQIK